MAAAHRAFIPSALFSDSLTRPSSAGTAMHSGEIAHYWSGIDFEMAAEVLEVERPARHVHASRSCSGWSLARPPPGSGGSRAEPSYALE
jgi:hypothetical protein